MVSLSYFVCCHSYLPLYLLFLCSGWLCTDRALWSPSTFLFCWFAVLGFYQGTEDSCLLWWGLLLCCLCFDRSGHWDFIYVRGNWPWWPCIKQIGGGWYSIWPWSVIFGWWAMDVAVAAALGCCTIGGLSQLGINGFSSSLNFLWDWGLLEICLVLDCISSQVLDLVWW